MLKNLLKDKPKKCSSLYIGENIPDKKKKKALNSYCPYRSKDDDIIALFDDTVFGSASDGFIITRDYIVSSYDKLNTISFNSIYSMTSDGKSIIINEDHKIEPTLKSSIDLIWLCDKLNQYRNYIYPPNQINNTLHQKFNDISDISLNQIIDETIEFNDKIYKCDNIPENIFNYLISIFVIDNVYENIINPEEVLYIISSQYTNDISDQEIIFITNKYIGLKNYSSYYPEIFNINSIKSCTIKGDIITLNFSNDFSINFHFNYIQNESLLIFSIIKYFIDKYNTFDETIDFMVFEKIYTDLVFKECQKSLDEFRQSSNELKSEINNALNSIHELQANLPKSIFSSNPLLKIISLLDGKAIIIVAFLRNNAPERVLNLLMNIPGVNIAAGTTKLILGKALNWLNNMLMKHGESYIMEQLVINFKNRNVSRSKLENDINSDLYTILGEDIVDKSIELLDKYMPKDDIPEDDINDSPETLNVNVIETEELDNIICYQCGSQNKNDAKFCSNCGVKLLKEYKCSKCGYSQQNAMKFCPECGNHI